MAKPTPARIEYKLNGETQILRFHSVISEGHDASSEITKYPTQEGFQVSNHAIRHNRKVSIEAVISNILIGDGDTSYIYSSNNSKTVFEILESLVNARIKCEVITNLGIYSPVVFNKFTTKQVAGFVDSMKFTISGEELQTSEITGKAAPSKLAKSPVLPERIPSIKTKLEEIEIETCSNPLVEEAGMVLGEDFSIESVSDTGEVITTTYVFKSKDPVTGEYIYETHVTGQDVYSIDVGGTNLGGVCPTPLEAGINDVSECLIDGAVDIATETITEVIDTAMGELKKSIYGAYYEVTGMTENEAGSALAGMAAGCAVRGITGNNSEVPYIPGESLPTTNDIIEGATKFGNELVNPSEVVETVTFIDCDPDPCDSDLEYTGLGYIGDTGGYA